MMTKSTTQQRPELMSEMADYIRSEADRMNMLVSHFLDFARPLQIRPVAADLRAVLAQVVKEQTPLASERGVQLTFIADGDLAFSFDRELIRVALSNLVQNAIEASSPGTEVRIECRSKEGEAELVVQDQGSGIAPQHLENIFNPFFTTKPQGTGLGLAIVAKIVDEHGGRIRTQSTPGAGTTFTVTLPKEQQT
jgi:two-component system sensor histidine kinase HydH